MAPLTWREVSAPTFSGVSESQKLAGQLMQNGIQSSIDALGKFSGSQKTAQSNAFAARIMGYGDGGTLRSALQDGSAFEGFDRGNISQEALQLADSHTRNLLGDTSAQLANAGAAEINSQNAWQNDVTQGYEAGRPAAVDLVNQIRGAASLGTDEGRARAAELQAGGSGVFASAGWSPDQVNAQINGNLATTEAGIGTNTALRGQGDAVRTHNQQTEATELFATVMQAAGNDVQTAERVIRENNNIDPQVSSLALGMLGSEQAALLQGPDANAATYLLDEQVNAARGGNPAPGGGGGNGSGPLRSLITSTESGSGGYSTLYGQSQQAGGAFEGVDVAQMTLTQMDAFDKEYGSWVKDNIGRVATPAGMFQIVGTTRRQVAEEMGLPGNTVFNQATQDAMFHHLVDKRLSGPRTMEGKMVGLRQEWAGFKNVSDNALSTAISAYENGDAGALSGMGMGSGAAPQQAQPTAAQDLFASALGSRGALDVTQNQALVTGTTELVNQAASVMDAMTVDGLFGTQAMAETLLDPSLRSQNQAQSIARVRDALGGDLEVQDGDITKSINDVMNRYDMTSGQAATVLQNVLQQNLFGTRWLMGDVSFDYSQLDDIVGSVYNKDGQTDGDKFRPAYELLETARSRGNAATNLEQQQSQVQGAQQRYFNLLTRSKNYSSPTIQKELERAQLEYQALLGQLQGTIKRVDGDPLIGFNR